jgi:hypothetical protein
MTINKDRHAARKRIQEIEGRAAWAEYTAMSESVSEKIARLKAARLSCEAAGKPKPKATGPIRKVHPIGLQYEPKRRRRQRNGTL